MLTFAYRVVVGLAFYLPLEDFLLKWLPVSDFVYLALRQVPDLLVLAAVGAVITSRLVTGERIRLVGRGVELALGALIAVAFVAVWMNEGSPLAALLNLKALLRYVLVLYVLFNVPLTEERVRNVFRALAATVGIQLVVAGIQWAGGVEVAQFFLPQTAGASVGGLDLHFAATWEAEKGRVFGTMGQTVGFAGLMIVGLALWVSTQGQRSLRYWLGILVFLVALYLSGSRAGLFTGIVVVLGHQFLVGRLKLSLAAGLYGAALAAVIVALVGVRLAESEVFFVFTERYVEIARNQRLGVVLSILPEFVRDAGTVRTLFGFSGDPSVVEGFIASMFNAPRTIVRRVGMVEDVYWGALILYYGVFGCGMMAYVVGRLGYEVGKVRRWASPVDRLPREAATVALLLLLAAIPLNLVGRAFEVRQFAFYLWAVVGLALACGTASTGRETGQEQDRRDVA